MSHNRVPARVPPFDGETLFSGEARSAFAPLPAQGYAPYAVDLLSMMSDDQLRNETIKEMLVPQTTVGFGVSKDGVHGAVQAPSGNGVALLAGLGLGAFIGVVGTAIYFATRPEPQPPIERT